MNNEWVTLRSAIAERLDDLSSAQFLILEYRTVEDPDAWPYAQAAPEQGIWYCEIESDRYLPCDEWPLDQIALRRHGWHAPDAETGNWWRRETTGTAATAATLLSGLHDGRRCHDPHQYSWRVGHFARPPDGGQRANLGWPMGAVA